MLCHESKHENDAADSEQDENRFHGESDGHDFLSAAPPDTLQSAYVFPRMSGHINSGI